MSFFNRRRGRQPQQESDRLKNIPDPSHASEKSSIRRFRHISTFTLFSSKFSRRPVENTVDFPTGSYRYGSRSPSPDPSLDIRMPAGLGRRASEMEERDCEGPLRQEGVNKYHDRQRSVSSPPFSQLMRWREGLASSDEHHSMASRSAITRIPPELLSTVFSFGARTDILSLAQVSKMFRSSALQALYSVLDLRDLDDERMERCVASIASRRDVAGLVRVFGCRSLPSYDNGPTSLTTVTFAIAFANMSQLSTLILPRFDANILFHAPFSLNSLTLLSTTISPDEFRGFTSWLAGQPSIHSLSLPNLLIDSLPDYLIPSAINPPYENFHSLDTLSSGHDTPCDTRPSNVLPHLSNFLGPASLATALISSRPLKRVVLPIRTTLYDGLKPSAIMSAMAFGRCTLKELAITPTTTKVDARTLERVLMSAGAELGNILEVLEVHWVLEDEILYKQIFAVIVRFRSLRTLRLYRDSPPPPPHSPPPLLPLPSTSSPLFSPHFSLLNHSSLSFPPTPSAKSHSNSVFVSPDTPLPRLHERSHLALWQKSCPALRNVVFLSGAEWRICPSLPGRSASPVLEFIGYAL